MRCREHRARTGRAVALSRTGSEQRRGPGSPCSPNPLMSAGMHGIGEYHGWMRGSSTRRSAVNGAGRHEARAGRWSVVGPLTPALGTGNVQLLGLFRPFFIEVSPNTSSMALRSICRPDTLSSIMDGPQRRTPFGELQRRAIGRRCAAPAAGAYLSSHSWEVVGTRSHPTRAKRARGRPCHSSA
jgi:hypothetical protein